MYERTFFGGGGGAKRLKRGAWIVCRLQKGIGKKRK